MSLDYQLSDNVYLSFSAFLHEKLGILLGGNKQYLVRSRLSSIARDRQYKSFDDFILQVISMQDSQLTDSCLELMTTNETFWFRDEYPYKILTNEILPALYKQKQNSHQSSLRIWSSACSSGQEPYSIAMVIDQFKKQYPSAFAGGVEITATDYSEKMVNTGRLGIYDELALRRGLPNELRARYFTPLENNNAKIDPTIQNMVNFRRLNLLNDFNSLGKFDIIFCRNVLIYFDGNQKQQILTKLAACLPQNGYLFLGAAESINSTNTLFKMKSSGTGFYYSRL